MNQGNVRPPSREFVEPEKKSNKTIYILAAILGALLLAVLGSVIYNKSKSAAGEADESPTEMVADTVAQAEEMPAELVDSVVAMPDTAYTEPETFVEEPADDDAEPVVEEPVRHETVQEEPVAPKVEKAESPSRETSAVSGDRVFDVVEEMPGYPGGNAAMMSYLSQNMRYPAQAREEGVQGRVVVSFVVEKDGSVSNVRVTRSVSPELDSEAKRLVSGMPKWNPGRQNGTPVRVKYNVPVLFRHNK